MPQRWFLVYDVPSREVRESTLTEPATSSWCASGRVSVAVDDGEHRGEVILDEPTPGVYIPPLVWGSQFRYDADAVLLVSRHTPMTPMTIFASTTRSWRRLQQLHDQPEPVPGWPFPKRPEPISKKVTGAAIRIASRYAVVAWSPIPSKARQSSMIHNEADGRHNTKTAELDMRPASTARKHPHAHQHKVEDAIEYKGYTECHVWCDAERSSPEYKPMARR